MNDAIIDSDTDKRCSNLVTPVVDHTTLDQPGIGSSISSGFKAKWVSCLMRREVFDSAQLGRPETIGGTSRACSTPIC